MSPGTRVYTRHRARWLENLVNGNNWKQGVEIGVFKGTTFKHLIENCPHLQLTGVDVFCSDHDWRREKITTTEDLNNFPAIRWYKDLLKFCEKYPDRAILWRDFSNLAYQRIEDNSLDFVFIDASHIYKYVAEDIDLWEPKVKKGGMVSGHDINMLQVRMAVQTCKTDFKEAQDNIWYYEK
jgi:predicted O-methyltransferase YrrM